jgi:uncharacterized Rossmann fold enzyme
MNFPEWEPHYREILEYFGFDRAEDEQAAEILSSLMVRDDIDRLRARVQEETVTVCGNAPCLKDQISFITGVVLAADAAAEVLDSRGVRPDAIFTDLDGATDHFLDMNRDGTIVVVHAHGDNIPLLKHWVPRFSGPIVATAQSAPLPRVYNFGGFTDGDRAVFAADALGAAEIRILGFDLDDRNVDPMKRGKLHWARRLLSLIGHDL